MNNFINSILHSLATENWYAAITLALTLPDICGAINVPGKNNSQARYSAWFDKYVGDKYSMTNHDGNVCIFMNGNDAYALRCALLHEGISNVSNQRARSEVQEKFIFHHSRVAYLHKLKDKGKLLIDIKTYCNDILNGVSEWQNDVSNDIDDRRRNSIRELLTLHLPDVHHGSMVHATINNPLR